MNLIKARHTKYIIITAAALAIGILFYLFYNEWVLVSLPKKKHLSHTIISNPAHRKSTILWYWHNNEWYHEDKEIIASNNKAQTLNYLVTSWLTLLDEEQILTKKVSLQSIMLDNSEQDAFISFDRSFFSKQASIYEKWMLIESFLKTIRSAQLNIQNLYFNVHHKTLNDPHLDFSHPWPISGFYE